MVRGMTDFVTEKGPTMLASTLHGVAILLKKARDCDWFINLSPSDYPLMPQDGLINFFVRRRVMERRRLFGWSELRRREELLKGRRLVARSESRQQETELGRSESHG